MTKFYVATRVRCVVVDAANEPEARELAMPDLQRLQDEVNALSGRNFPVQIHVVRLATDDEIEMYRWSRELL